MLRDRAAVVPGPMFSSSPYTPPLAGLVRSTSAPFSAWLLISNVCQPGVARCQTPPQEESLKAMAVADADALGGAELPQAAAPAASTALAAAASRPRVRMPSSGLVTLDEWHKPA